MPCGVVEQTMRATREWTASDNNIAGSDPRNVIDLPLEKWREIFALNVDTMMLMCKYAIPAMVSTECGWRRRPSGHYWLATRSAPAEFDSLQRDEGCGDRADVDAQPSTTGRMASEQTASPWVRCSLPGDGSGIFDAWNSARCAPRPGCSGVKGTGWDTAHLARFLLSKQSNFLTGQNIWFDGGVSLVGSEALMSLLGAGGGGWGVPAPGRLSHWTPLARTRSGRCGVPLHSRGARSMRARQAGLG